MLVDGAAKDELDAVASVLHYRIDVLGELGVVAAFANGYLVVLAWRWLTAVRTNYRLSNFSFHK